METTEKQEVKSKSYKSAGIHIYYDLPDGVHQATIDDIYKNGKIRVDRWFIIKSMVRDHYYACYQIRKNFRFSEWIPWYNSGRMFFKNE